MGKGNYIGRPNDPTYISAPGIWSMAEVRNALREDTWPWEIERDGLQLYYDARNNASYPGSGTTWLNLAGNTALNGTIVNGSYTTDNGGGIVFGSTTTVTIPAGLTFSSNDFTINVLLKHTGTVNTSRTQRYFTLSSSPGEGPVLRHDTSSAAALHGYVFDSGSTFRSITVANQIYTGTLYYLSLRYNGSTLRSYVNGVRVGSLAAVFTLPTPSGTSTLGSSVEYFEGHMYSVSYYNKAISEDQIQRNFKIYEQRYTF